MAGESFEKYGITHAGIGVWDTTSDQKFTIEFISEDYVGALLPDFDDDTQSLVWKNQGQVVFTVPTSNKNWLNSQLICDTSGVAYNQLVTYIEDNIDLFASFQPVEVVYYNASLLSNATEYTNTELDKSGHLKVAKTDSFFFVNKIVHLLTDYGADTESFLQIYGTAYQYISRYNEAAGVVSWSADGPANTEVYQWYQALSACYQDVYDATVNNGEGAEYFLDVSLHMLLVIGGALTLKQLPLTIGCLYALVLPQQISNVCIYLYLFYSFTMCTCSIGGEGVLRRARVCLSL